MGSDEIHFNVSVGSDGQSHKTVSTNHNLFEEKGEPKRYRTEVLPPTSLTPYRRAKPTHGVFYLIILIEFIRDLEVATCPRWMRFMRLLHAAAHAESP